MVPPGVFADLILVHAQFGFGLFEALFDGPTQATQPHKQGYARAQWGVADIVPIGRVLPDGALHHEPHGSGGQAVATEGDLSLGKFISQQRLLDAGRPRHVGLWPWVKTWLFGRPSPPGDTS